jgi:hypothetical protein
LDWYIFKTMKKYRLPRRKTEVMIFTHTPFFSRNLLRGYIRDAVAIMMFSLIVRPPKCT